MNKVKLKLICVIETVNITEVHNCKVCLYMYKCILCLQTIGISN